MFVAKVTEIIASSSESFDDAVNKGIKSVGETLENVRSAWVKDLNVVVENGKITEYHVTMKISFVLKDWLDFWLKTEPRRQRRIWLKELEKLSEQERQVVERFVHRGRIARNVTRDFGGATDLRAAARKQQIEMLERLVAEDCALLPACSASRASLRKPRWVKRDWSNAEIGWSESKSPKPKHGYLL
jgi:dodecin